MLEPRHLLFTYLHLAADKPQAEGLMKSGATCIAYETVTSKTGALPLLKPMSEVAGRMSVQVGAHYLEKEPGGRGVLLGGVPGVAPAKVAILGGGVAGVNAAQMAVGMRADVTIYDINNERLAELDMFFGRQIKTAYASRDAIARAVDEAELVIGAVLVPGAAAPKLVTREMLKTMKRGIGAGRYRHRPGRLFRNQPSDHPFRPGVRGRRRDPLLRRQHAGRGRAHLGVRAQQCHAAVCASSSPIWAPKKRCARIRTSPTASTCRAARSAMRRSPKRSTFEPARRLRAGLTLRAGGGSRAAPCSISSKPSSTIGRQLASAGALARISRHNATRPPRDCPSGLPPAQGRRAAPDSPAPARPRARRHSAPPGVIVRAWSVSALPRPDPQFIVARMARDLGLQQSWPHPRCCRATRVHRPC